MKYNKYIYITSLLLNVFLIVQFWNLKGGTAYIAAKIHPVSQSEKSLVSPAYVTRKDIFDSLPKQTKPIIFLGDSITHNSEWSELLQKPNIENRGISGDITSGVLNRLDNIIQQNPEKIFLMIGINDIEIGRHQDEIINDYEQILKKLTDKISSKTLYIQSVLPINEKQNKKIKNSTIIDLNNKIKDISIKYNVKYIDLNSAMTDSEGNLKKEYTYDGIHINGRGYEIWAKCIKPYIE
jgi:lysophospholipase L1-like esterase